MSNLMRKADRKGKRYLVRYPPGLLNAPKRSLSQSKNKERNPGRELGVTVCPTNRAECDLLNPRRAEKGSGARYTSRNKQNSDHCTHKLEHLLLQITVEANGARSRLFHLGATWLVPPRNNTKTRTLGAHSHTPGKKKRGNK